MQATRNLIAAAMMCGGLAACAPETAEIGVRRMPDVTYRQYERYSCGALDAEIRRVASSLRRVGELQDDAAYRDDLTVGAAAIVPPLAPWTLLITTESDYRREVARLKGQYEALREAAGVNRCEAALRAPQNMAEPPGGEIVFDLRLPPGPKPFEGVKRSRYSADQIAAYCALSWRTIADPETGRTLYNPCHEVRGVNDIRPRP